MSAEQIFHLCVLLIGTIAGCYIIPKCINLFLNYYHNKGEQKKDFFLLDITEKLTELLSEYLMHVDLTIRAKGSGCF